MTAAPTSVLPPDATLEASRLDAVYRVLRDAKQPVAVAKIVSALKPSLGRCNAKQCLPWAEALVESGRAFRFQAGKTVQFWAYDHRHYAGELIKAAAAKGKGKTAADLDKLVAGKKLDVTRADRDALLEALVRDGAIHRCPATGRGAMRYSTTPPDPRVYLQSAVKAFRKSLDAAVAKLGPVGMPRDRIVAAALEALSLAAPGERNSPAVAPAATPPAAPNRHALSPAEFAARFDAEFARLDRQRGSHNFVSLVDLRQAIAECDRAAFDAGLHALRREGRYGLSAAEGIHGTRSEELQAGIREAGALLLFASRRQP